MSNTSAAPHNRLFVVAMVLTLLGLPTAIFSTFNDGKQNSAVAEITAGGVDAPIDTVMELPLETTVIEPVVETTTTLVEIPDETTTTVSKKSTTTVKPTTTKAPTTTAKPTTTKAPTTTTAKPTTTKAPTTTAKPTTTLVAVAPSDAWAKLAQCESGGNWAMDIGIYSGGLSILTATWIAYGGAEFAPKPGQASQAQQIVIAERIRAGNGGSYRAWPSCAARYGLP